MSKKEMKLEDLLKSPQYQSIINLTLRFQDKELFYKKEIGLRLLHYRWALIKDHDGIKDQSFVTYLQDFFSTTVPLEYTNQLSNQKKMGESNLTEREYFLWVHNKSLDHFIKESSIKKNCFNGKYPNHNLENFLNKLVNKYKILEKRIDKDGIPRYYFPLKNIEKIMIIHEIDDIKNLLDSFSYKQIHELWQYCFKIAF